MADSITSLPFLPFPFCAFRRRLRDDWLIG